MHSAEIDLGNTVEFHLDDLFIHEGGLEVRQNIGGFVHHFAGMQLFLNGVEAVSGIVEKKLEPIEYSLTERFFIFFGHGYRDEMCFLLPSLYVHKVPTIS